jgi:hypothetical protein
VKERNKLKTLAISAFALSAITTVSIADSSDFAGPYVGIQFGAAGVELDGSNTDGNGAITKAKGGAVSYTAGADVGYAFPVNDSIVIAIGASYVPIDGDIFGTQDGDQASNPNGGDTATDPTTVTFSVGDHYTVYIQPTFAISDTAAVYAKAGWATAEVSVQGQTLVKAPDDLEGVTLALGTKVNMANGMYIQSEAGMTDYDRITATGNGDTTDAGSIGLNGSVAADPAIAYGMITVGMQF